MFTDDGQSKARKEEVRLEESFGLFLHQSREGSDQHRGVRKRA